MTKTFAAKTDAKNAWEDVHNALALQAALESIVLLENNGALPISPSKIALFGAGARRTVKGGSGSGEVNERHAVSIAEGLEAEGFQITTHAWLDEYDALYRQAEADYAAAFRKKLYRLDVTQLINLMRDPFCPPQGRSVTPADIRASGADTCIYVVARQAGEGSDRRLDKNDCSLSVTEQASIALCAQRYKTTILVLNVGGSFDMGFLEEIPGIDAVIFYAQQGGAGGTALAQLLCGKATPSGKLASTWAKRYDDLPFAWEYSYLNGNLKEEYYKEGIYVGYRYFDTFSVEPRYPFGYGLSYTTHSIQPLSARLDGSTVTVRFSVTNTGSTFAGKEVVQLYVACPQSEKLPKEAQRLAAFTKTELLLPGQQQTATVTFDVQRLSSFREADAATVLEPGCYILSLGNSSRNTRPFACITLEQEVILSRHGPICRCPVKLEELRPAHREAASTAGLIRLVLKAESFRTLDYNYRKGALNESPHIKELLDHMTVRQQISVCVGGGLFGKRPFDAPGAAGITTAKLIKKGIPNVVLADGPAGIRVQKLSVQRKNGSMKPVQPPMAIYSYLPKFIQKFLLGDPKKGQLLYQYATAFPVELALAQTWNLPLAQQIGTAVGEEMNTWGISFWLAPALNIHRNPLCGRNFEYFSEDPLVSGLFAAAMTKGVQSVPGKFVTLKHFACNNQEDGRNHTNANVSQRALREVYLKGFEIAVKESAPGAIMTSYNRLNGTYTPNREDLLTRLLRSEWGFRGLVMTDWLATGRGLADTAKALAAGNDLIMPGNADAEKAIRKGLKKGILTHRDIRRCAANVLQAILASAPHEL